MTLGLGISVFIRRSKIIIKKENANYCLVMEGIAKGDQVEAVVFISATHAIRELGELKNGIGK
jgi:hypothetical protein